MLFYQKKNYAYSPQKEYPSISFFFFFFYSKNIVLSILFREWISPKLNIYTYIKGIPKTMCLFEHLSDFIYIEAILFEY